MLEHDWEVWKFVSQPDRWLDKESQRALLDHIGNELGVRKMEDWYQVKVQDVVYVCECSKVLRIPIGGLEEVAC